MKRLIKALLRPKVLVLLTLLGLLVALPLVGYWAWQKRIPQKIALVMRNIVYNLFIEKHPKGDIYGVVKIGEMKEVYISELELPEEEEEKKPEEKKEEKPGEKPVEELPALEEEPETEVALAPKEPVKVKRLPLHKFPKEFLPLKRVLHPPFKMGACAVCHQVNEHGEVIKVGNRYPLTKPRIDELCYTCHKERYLKKYDHKPVKEGKCLKCHDPHQSDTKKLLKAPSVPLLCASCHAPDKARKLRIKKVVDINVRYKHKPVDKDCTKCHDPHTSDHPKLLITSLDWRMEFCLDCHAKVKDPEVRKKIDIRPLITKAKVKHDAVYKKNKCMNCHNVHGSNNRGMLWKNPVQQCLECHNKPLKKRENGYVLMNMEKHLKENKYWHKPIEEYEKRGGCAACHNPHGSDNIFILKGFFPEGFYVRGLAFKDLICFNCHKERERFTQKYTTTATKFRNGNLNLHWVHVQGRKGRSCVACHDPHASQWPTLIGKYTNFNGILFPINYKKTPTGGSCAPACHDEYRYDRLRPVENVPKKGG
ncbi:MAG: hypothetical protein GXO03_02515 [Aquificae bacterium]|nr:hypothetical protein [Aquificota bacterium]